MEQQNLQDKILGIIDTATEEKQRWDDLTPTDPDYMMHSPKSVGYHETNEQLYLFQNLLVGFNPSQSILDIGSGRGDMCNFITEFFGEPAPWTGIDHNPIMVYVCAQNSSESKLTAADWSWPIICTKVGVTCETKRLEKATKNPTAGKRPRSLLKRANPPRTYSHRLTFW